MSTSKPRLSSWTIRASRPTRAASARWRANEPGPYANSKSAADRNRAHWCAVAPVVGHQDRDLCVAVSGDVVERGRVRQVAVYDDNSRQALLPYPCAARGSGRVERARVVDAHQPAVVAPRRDFFVARDDDDRARPGGCDHRLGHTTGESDAGVVVECGGEACLPEAEGANRDDDPGRGAHGVRMLPAVDVLYSVAKGAFYPGLRYGLRWTIEGVEHIAPSGPVILASNHISYLDPLTLAYVADKRKRRLRYLAKAELFDKPGLGVMLKAAHQIPVQRGTSDAASSLASAVEALGRGECVAVFPEGTISLDLEPMTGKSGAARLAKAAGVAVTPVGLWGSHRIMFKGRKPHWQTGVAQVAVVGKPVTVEPDEHVKRATDRIMAAIADCVARAREIYPQQPAPGEDAWWVREPETASVRVRTP